MEIPMQYIKKHLFLVNDDGFEDDEVGESEAGFFLQNDENENDFAKSQAILI